MSVTLAVILGVVCIAVVGGTRQQDSFYFDPAPVSQNVIEGSSVRLRCDVSNRQQISFYWTLNGKPVTNTSRRWQDGSDLRITWVDREQDQGSLRCIATNVTTGIALRSAEAKLNILCKHRVSSLFSLSTCTDKLCLCHRLLYGRSKYNSVLEKALNCVRKYVVLLLLSINGSWFLSKYLIPSITLLIDCCE